MSDPIEAAKSAYRAYQTGERAILEDLLAEDFVFHSPPDPLLDRDAYFERCWPNARTLADFEFVRLIEHGDEVVVTYEATKTDGKRFRNTEVLRFAGEKLAEVEVYSGWDLD